jgi:hypothetical protein
MLGIDISRWQGVLNFKKVNGAKPVDKAGAIRSEDQVRFAYLKATHGTGIDPEFATNAGPSGEHMDFRDFYMWFVPTMHPFRQADAFVDASAPYRDNEKIMLPWIDFEDDAGGRVRCKSLRDGLRACAQQIEDRIGQKIAIYTGKWFWLQAVEPSILDAAGKPTGQRDIDEAFSSWCASRPLAHAEYPGRIPGEGEHGHVASPWADRDLVETWYQFDGDKGLYLPADCGTTGSPIDSDFDRFNGSAEDLKTIVSWSKFGSIMDTIPPFFAPQTTPFAAGVDQVQLFK